MPVKKKLKIPATPVKKKPKMAATASSTATISSKADSRPSKLDCSTRKIDSITLRSNWFSRFPPELREAIFRACFEDDLATLDECDYFEADIATFYECGCFEGGFATPDEGFRCPNLIKALRTDGDARLYHGALGIFRGMATFIVSNVNLYKASAMPIKLWQTITRIKLQYFHWDWFLYPLFGNKANSLSNVTTICFKVECLFSSSRLFDFSVTVPCLKQLSISFDPEAEIHVIPITQQQRVSNRLSSVGEHELRMTYNGNGAYNLKCPLNVVLGVNAQLTTATSTANGLKPGDLVWTVERGVPRSCTGWRVSVSW